MDLIKAIATRKSTREFKAGRIPSDAVEALLSAASAAPIGMSKYESMHLTVVQDETVMAHVREATAKTMRREGNPLYDAPLFILISSTEQPFPGIEFTNAGCMAQNILLTATSLGIGGVVVWGAGKGVGADEPLKKELGLPQEYDPLVGISLGYPSTPDETERELTMRIPVNRI